LLLGVDKRGFTQRVKEEGVKLENREGQTQKERRRRRGQGEKTESRQSYSTSMTEEENEKENVEMMKEELEQSKTQGQMHRDTSGEKVGGSREAKEGCSLHGACHTLRSKAECRADEDRIRWGSFLILLCHSEVLKAELKVDKEAVVKRVRFLQKEIKTTNYCILHPLIIKGAGLPLHYQALDP